MLLSFLFTSKQDVIRIHLGMEPISGSCKENVTVVWIHPSHHVDGTRSRSFSDYNPSQPCFYDNASMTNLEKYIEVVFGNKSNLSHTKKAPRELELSQRTYIFKNSSHSMNISNDICNSVDYHLLIFDIKCYKYIKV